MKIGVLTFHGAHNYGSVLQAYALQTFVQDTFRARGIECDYKIINYRTNYQKEIYGGLPASTLKRRLKRLLEVPYRNAVDCKAGKFEKFLTDYLNLTEEINNEDSLLEHADEFDVYISGSDQIWNIRAMDFSFAYLCEFTNKKKVSYAASLGPLDIRWSKYDKKRYINDICQFSSISVREEKSQKMVDELIGANHSEIHVDPTLLLKVEEWREIQSEYNYQEGKYILFYCLEPNKRQLRIAESLAERYHLPILITGYRNKFDYCNSFVKCYDAGPLDFLSLVNHAKYVITSSFHGTVFSMIYNKRFCVINGMADNRISNLLIRTGMESFSFDENDDVKNIEFKECRKEAFDQYIVCERSRSEKYLVSALLI